MEAAQTLELAAWFAPQEPLYRRDLAIAQAMRGNLEEAEETYEALKAMGTASQEDLLLVEGELAYANGRYEEALTPILQLARGQGNTLTG